MTQSRCTVNMMKELFGGFSSMKELKWQNGALKSFFLGVGCGQVLEKQVCGGKEACSEENENIMIHKKERSQESKYSL